MRPTLLALAFLPVLAQSPARQGEAILARVDRLRHPWPSFTVDLTVQDAKAVQRWRVAARENGDVRLDGLSERERGRSVLMLGDEMWLLLPGTRRPLKVTPQQRLMGSAAGGDVARTRFRDDYTVAGLVEEAQEGRACWRLDLEAARPAISARRVTLWVAREGILPLKAEFHLASGRLARTVRFGPPVAVHGQWVLSGMESEEPGGARTALTFGNWSREGLAPSAFERPPSVR